MRAEVGRKPGPGGTASRPGGNAQGLGGEAAGDRQWNLLDALDVAEVPPPFPGQHLDPRALIPAEGLLDPPPHRTDHIGPGVEIAVGEPEVVFLDPQGLPKSTKDSRPLFTGDRPTFSCIRHRLSSRFRHHGASTDLARPGGFTIHKEE